MENDKNMLTHFDSAGRARMVDVSGKDETKRTAVACGQIKMKPETLKKIAEGQLAKGDVLGVAQIAGITGAKKTSSLIPMSHAVMLSALEMDFKLNFECSTVEITSKAVCNGVTGVEMEALSAVSAAALTIYDMCKAVDKDMMIEGIRLLEKTGGKSGPYKAPSINE